MCVCFSWFCSVFYNSLILKDGLYRPEKFHSCYGECVIVVDPTGETADLVLTFIVPVTVIVFLYVKVFAAAVSQARAVRSHVTAVTLSVSRSTKKSELKAARTLGVLVLVFLICFCPYYCVSVGGNSIFSSSSASFVVYLFYLNSCINPVIYALFYPWFRKAVKHIGTLKILQPGSCEANIL